LDFRFCHPLTQYLTTVFVDPQPLAVVDKKYFGPAIVSAALPKGCHLWLTPYPSLSLSVVKASGAAQSECLIYPGANARGVVCCLR
jgi:hypothetical protein